MGRSYSSVSQKFGVRGVTIANWKRKHPEGTLQLDRRGKPIMNNFDASIATVVIEEHEGLNGVYGTVHLKYLIEQKLDWLSITNISGDIRTHLIVLDKLGRSNHLMSKSRKKRVT